MSCIHPEDKDFVLEKSNEARATLSTSAFYHRILTKDGTVKYIYSKTEFDFKDGKPVGMHGICRDVTEFRKSEEAREQSDLNLLYIIDLIPQAIFVRNAQGKYQFVNKSFAASYGFTPREFMRRAKNNEIETPGVFLAYDKEIIDTGITKTIPELVFTNSDGHVRVF